MGPHFADGEPRSAEGERGVALGPWRNCRSACPPVVLPEPPWPPHPKTLSPRPKCVPWTSRPTEYVVGGKRISWQNKSRSHILIRIWVLGAGTQDCTDTPKAPSFPDLTLAPHRALQSRLAQSPVTTTPRFLYVTSHLKSGPPPAVLGAALGLSCFSLPWRALVWTVVLTVQFWGHLLPAFFPSWQVFQENCHLSLRAAGTQTPPGR